MLMTWADARWEGSQEHRASRQISLTESSVLKNEVETEKKIVTKEEKMVTNLSVESKLHFWHLSCPFSIVR